MSDWREELIKKMARKIAMSRYKFAEFDIAARAALEVAEPVIREQCAAEADHRCKTVGNGYDEYSLACRHVAAAIREGGK